MNPIATALASRLAARANELYAEVKHSQGYRSPLGPATMQSDIAYCIIEALAEEIERLRQELYRDKAARA